MLIRAGQVKVNGRVRSDPEFPVDLPVDKIQASERPVEAREFVYLVLNKPRGVVTTAADEKGRETVYDFIDKSLPWVGPVGRLDKASEGLLLLTNDTEWSARVLAPESLVEKVYHVQIRSSDPAGVVCALLPSVTSHGESLHTSRVKVLRNGRRNCWLEIVLNEGKNRHIRRMLDALEVEVLRLVRVSIGPLQLGTLAKGKTRELSSEEKAELDHAIAIPH